MKLIKLMIIGLIFTASAAAQANCRITLKLCKPLGIAGQTAFADAYDGSAVNPNRCLQRAREYHTYCKSKQEVGAEFYVNGVLTISAYVTDTSSNLWTKAANNQWILIPGGY